jgi:hypothetical protein
MLTGGELAQGASRSTRGRTHQELASQVSPPSVGCATGRAGPWDSVQSYTQNMTGSPHHGSFPRAGPKTSTPPTSGNAQKLPRKCWIGLPPQTSLLSSPSVTPPGHQPSAHFSPHHCPSLGAGTSFTTIVPQLSI